MVMACKLSLDQSQFSKGKRRFELHEKEQLHVYTKDYTGQRSYVLELQNLTHKTLVAMSTAWMTWIIAYFLAAVALIFAAAMVLGAADQPLEKRLATAVPSGILSLFISSIAFTFFRRAARNSYDVTIFYHRYGGQAAFSVFNGKPDREKAQNFIHQIIGEIERAAPFEVKGDGLVDQLGRLDELRSRGVLSEEEFASAKQRLLGMGVEKKPIGF